ncbi:hypothetical protein K438DRAFT_1179818 [Mycena galopus ATCC 62051]|nr:hypothetical protein K438DRAFT_1179818 [Mycena galopus ATCC 62051]
MGFPRYAALLGSTVGLTTTRTTTLFVRPMMHCASPWAMAVHGFYEDARFRTAGGSRTFVTTVKERGKIKSCRLSSRSLINSQ